MLYNLNWLNPGQSFPPKCEVSRIERYMQNAQLFDGDHFDDPTFRTHDSINVSAISVYQKCAERIEKIIGNFEDVISFPVLLNYQRLMSLKMADLVCGEYPQISGATPDENATIAELRDYCDYDAKAYSTVLDISRYGDAIWRLYRDDTGRNTFTCWNPTQWFPIVRQDGTNSIKAHCLCWRENESEDPDNPDWKLQVQIHSCEKKDFGYYEHRVYSMSEDGSEIVEFDSSELVPTGFDCCAVIHNKAFSTTNSVYGYDDYIPVDSLLAEIMARIGQISAILDKHASPNITGPTSMLKVDPKTGEYHLQTGSFFAVSPGEEHPEYMTWDGHLEAAFKQLELLINQLYILSEMGAALLGGQDSASQAISGTAMRFKMVNPLAKARRISNALTRPVKQLFQNLSMGDDKLEYKNISVMWADGLPDDPREQIESAKLATGIEKMMPLEKAIMEFFGRSNEEARKWIDDLRNQMKEFAQLESDVNPNHAGPQDGTGVNPMKKGSATGINNFHSQTNANGTEDTK